ncbi:hypothetical protein [Amycolatopsis viridis]|uniref:Integral membrane protein n=1 Tax=Amycolatopsis viridis TaxID=185678 RepID=A0ABX0T0X0_9PSEU|nr:hypothetical protein [Amycolatopsis viridis]NIH81539.1 hypothetical protein [Amycolatopsis viridis]
MTASNANGGVPVSRIAARVTAAAGCAIFVVFVVVVAATTSRSDGQDWAGDYTDLRGLASWLVTAMSEPQFYAVAAAGLGLFLGGLVAHLAQRASRRWAGFVQACGTGIWPPVVGTAVVSLALGILAWGWTLRPGLWQPLFVPLVATAPAMVVLYGPALRVCVTAAVSGALVTPPASILVVEYVCGPAHLPPVVGATAGMWIGALVAFGACRFLPWMPPPGEWRSVPAAAPPTPATSPWWVLRRALADFSEAQFFGNEWASGAMLAAAVLAYLVSPSALAYGTGLFLAVLASQALTALAGVLMWRKQWRALGFYPTFVPVVSVAPATVLALGGTVGSVIAGALAGALVGPPLAAAISRRLPGSFHPFIGNVASMSFSTAAIVPLLNLVPGMSA